MNALPRQISLDKAFFLYSSNDFKDSKDLNDLNDLKVPITT